MEENEFLREFFKMNQEDAENLVKKMMKLRTNPVTHLVCAFSDNEEDALLNVNQLLDGYGNIFYLESFQADNSSQSLYVFQLDHLDSDTEELQKKCAREYYSFIPVHFIEGKKLKITRNEHHVMLVSISPENHRKEILLNVSLNKQKIVVELARFLEDKLGADFEDVFRMNYPSLIFIPEDALLSNEEPVISCEHISDAINELYERYFEDEFSSSVFFYTAGLNHFAIYEKAAVKNIVSL